MAKPSLSWLDVGCEDGENTAVAYEEFRKSDLRVSLTAIDTSHQTDVNKLLEYSAFLNGSEWAFEKFSTDIPRDVRFDIITSVHSWYLIDLSYLIDMYRILSEEGVAAFVLAPLESNIINQITCHVDRYIRKKFKAKASPYKEKVAALDPYRNYAEDLAFSCYQFFGEDGVHLVKRRGHIKTERLITKGGELTPEAKAVADFFAHRMTLLDDDVYDQIGAIILEHDSGGRVGCDEWEIVLDKARIMSSKREMMVSATLETTLATK
jgi:SAM-dependent methyltransferase